MNPFVFKINEAIAKINEEKNNIKKYEATKEKAIVKLGELVDEIKENAEAFYSDEEKMDIMGRCHYVISECNKKIKKSNEKIKVLEYKIKKITSRR